MVPLPRFLKPYRDAGAFNSLLAPHRFIDENVFLTKSNQLGVVLTAEGIDYECLTNSMLESGTRRVAAAWRLFDEQFRLYQYVIKQDRADLDQKRDYPSPAVRSTVSDRREHLEGKPAGLYTIRLVYVLLYEPPALNQDRALHRTVSTKKVLRVVTAELERHRAVLLDRAQSFRRNIGDLLGITLLGKQEAFQFFRELTNPDPDIARAERLKHSGHIDYYMASSPLTCSREGISVGDARLEVLSLKEPPHSTFPHVLRDLLSLETNFVLCTEFKRISNDRAITTIRTAQNHFHWSQWVADLPSILSMVLNRGNRQNVIADKSAVNDVEDLDRTLARINNDGEYLGEFSFTVVLYDSGNQARLRRAASDVMKIFGNHEASLIRETYNALNAFLSIIPGNQAFNLRRTWLLSGNYADLSFLYAPYGGEKVNRHLRSEHLVVLETNDRTPYYFNLHEGDKLGTLIFGAPGSGKSVLANLLIDHSQKHEPRTFILDLGGSYRQITRKHGGSYLHMDFGDGRQSFRINPFTLAGTAENLQFLFTFVRLLLTSSGFRPTADDDRELFEAVEGMYVLDPEHRTLGNLGRGLPPHMAPYLHAWIRGGQYGSVFDNREDTLTFSHFQTFDFQGMDEVYPKVLEPLLFYIFQRISAIVYSPALAPVYKQLWADEVWRFLSNETARQYLVSAGKTWRKHNGGIGLITQSAVDLANAGVLELVNEICPAKILLANPGADHAAYQTMFHLNEKEVELFSRLTPKRQFLLKTEARAKVLNVDLDPRAYWQYTNSPYDNQRRETVLAEHGFEAGFDVLAGEAV
ncbi:MAG: type secretion system protein TrbE [Bryobacterales bacterium]|nr:type secretion system protein TrbE [Bryobacterales bacterium]